MSERTEAMWDELRRAEHQYKVQAADYKRLGWKESLDRVTKRRDAARQAILNADLPAPPEGMNPRTFCPQCGTFQELLVEDVVAGWNRVREMEVNR